jgi:KaiC/GvpD/RAD55 family RecA-like ATPase
VQKEINCYDVRYDSYMSKVEEKLKAIPPNSIVILESPPEENQMSIIADFLRSKASDKGIYVSSNRATTDLSEKLLTYGYDLRKAVESGRICVVDLVSRSVGASELPGGMYVSSPSELSATQMAIENAVERLEGEPKKTWLLLDSISTLLVFSSSGALLQFLHFLVGRLRALQFNGIIVTVEGSIAETTLPTIKQFCDMVIRL